MEYMTSIRNYVSEHTDAIKNAALGTLAAIVLAAGVAGCANTKRSGWEFSLMNVEYGQTSTKSEDPNIQQKVLETPPKYSDKANVAPGKGLGVSYK